MPDFEQKLENLRNEFDALGQNPDPEKLQDFKQRTQELMRVTTGSPLNARVEALFHKILNTEREISSSSAQGDSEVDHLLRRTRVRVRVARDPSDQRQALDLLRQVLDLDEDNSGAYELLETLYEQNPDFKKNILNMLKPFTSRSPRATRLIAQLNDTPPEETRSAASRPTPDPSYSSTFSDAPGEAPATSEIEQLTRRMTDLYYQGEYRETINLCNKLLNLDPDHEHAREYREKAEDYLARGYVPDNRIPLEARMAFHKGNSAKRAGMYKEAQDLYRRALDLAQAEGLERWADAENALIEIEDLALAKELVGQGDALAKADKWEEAAQKYESSLELSESPRVRRKYEALDRAIQVYRQSDVRLATLSGSLHNMAQQLQVLRRELSEAREYWPNSRKLQELWSKVDTRSHESASRLKERGEQLLYQANEAHTIADRLRLHEEALRYLEMAHNLQAEDIETDTLLLTVKGERDKANNAKRLLDEAERALNLRDVQGNDDALAKLRHFADDYAAYTTDMRYRALLAKLQRYFLESATSALSMEGADLEYVRTQLEKARGRPFNFLGLPPNEFGALEQRVAREEKRRQSKARQPYILGGVGIFSLFLLLLLSRNVWYPIVNPPPTATPTITLPPTITLTSTVPPTPTETASPTPGELCLGITKATSRYYVYESPTRSSTQLGTTPPERPVRILDQTRDKDGRLWYRIDYGAVETTQIGWIPAEFVVEVTACPRLP